MASVNIPTFVDGDVADATEVSKAFYDGATTATSMEELNGNLTRPNMPNNKLVTREMVRRRHLAGGRGVSGTANLDYFEEWFDSTTTNIELDDDAALDNNSQTLHLYRPIPGGCIQFDLGGEANVALTWTILWGNDSYDGNAATFVRLFINGLPIDDQVRLAPRGSTTPAIGKQHGQVLVPSRARFWCGHHAVNLSRGSHSASLRILGEKSSVTRQNRVWARSMRHFYFHTPE